MSIEEIIKEINKEYDDAKSSDFTKKLIETLQSGKGTYKEVYEYADHLGVNLGEILENNILNIDFEDSPKVVDVIRSYTDDISEAGIMAQTSLNEASKVNIKPQKGEFDSEKAEGLIRNIISEKNGKEAVANFGMTFVDETIRENAEIQNKSGYEISIIREYDNIGLHRKTKWAKPCLFCIKRAKTYDYETIKEKGNEAWQRHVGCGCSIIFKNKGITKKVLNYKKNVEADKEPTKRQFIYKDLEDVTKQYTSKKASKSKLITDPNVSESDKKTAKWYVDNFGGEVHVLDERKGKGEMNPDALINGKYWEFKSPQKIARIDDRLRKANEQIIKAQTRIEKVGDQAGIIVDIGKITDASESETLAFLEKIFVKRIQFPADLIVKNNDELVVIIRKQKNDVSPSPIGGLEQ